MGSAASAAELLVLNIVSTWQGAAGPHTLDDIRKDQRRGWVELRDTLVEGSQQFLAIPGVDTCDDAGAS